MAKNEKLKEFHLQTLSLKVSWPPSSPQSDDTRACFVNSFMTFIKVGHLHCVIPFELAHDKKGNLIFRSGTFHKVICSIVMVTCVGFRCYECMKMHPKKGDVWTPPMFFRVIYGYCNISFHCSLWNGFWRGHHYHQLLKFCQESPSLPMPPALFKNAIRILPYIFWGFTIGVGLLTTFSGVGLLNASWTISAWFNSFILTGKDVLRFETVAHSSVDYEMPWTWYDVPLGIFMVAGVYIRQVTGFLEEFLILNVTIMLWLPSYGFAKQVQALSQNELSVYSQWHTTKQSYLALKRLSELVNQAIWGNVSTHTILALFYYSFNFDALLLTDSHVHRIRILTYFWSAALFYLLGADVCEQINSFETWLAKVNLEENANNLIPSGQLSIILHELQTNKIGIQCGKFTLTYGMVASIMGVVMTYFIICVQSRVDISGDKFQIYVL